MVHSECPNGIKGKGKNVRVYVSSHLFGDGVTLSQITIKRLVDIDIPPDTSTVSEMVKRKRHRTITIGIRDETLELLYHTIGQELLRREKNK